MATKKKHALDLAWRCLLACVEREGRGVTAVSLAKEMGVCYNTARVRLVDLMAEDVVLWKTEWRGNVAVTLYSVKGHAL
jgi:predicted ArsR family transcriptional regulator